MPRATKDSPPPEEHLGRSDSLAIMKMVHDHYRMDIEQIWKRGAVYLAVSSALIVLLSSRDDNDNVPEFVVIGIGVMVSISWLLNACISHHWISVWRNELMTIDEKINPFKSFSRCENKEAWRSLIFRPQFTAVGLPILVLLIWLFLAISSAFRP